MLLLCLGTYALLLVYRVFAPLEFGAQYSAQAVSWLRGHLDLVVQIRESDFVRWDDRTYLPIPFLPTIFVAPFVLLFGPSNERGIVPVYEALASPLVGMLNILLFYQVCRRSGCPLALRPWLLALFALGSLHFHAVANGSNWQLSHLVATTFLLLLLWEALGHGRPVLMGAAVGLASLARPSAWFALPFCFLAGWAAGKRGRPLLAHGLGVALGTLPIVAIWLWYNWARFGSPFESGYAPIWVPDCIGVSLRAHGAFSLAYIPKNLYLMLLLGPQPYSDEPVLGAFSVVDQCTTVSALWLYSPTLDFPWIRPSEWGMGLLFTTPALVYAFAARLQDRWAVPCWVAVVSILAVTLTYYSPGWIQFGYRYTLDFLPFLLLLIARGLHDGPPRRFKALVLTSTAVELWGMWIWNAYPPV